MDDRGRPSPHRATFRHVNFKTARWLFEKKTGPACGLTGRPGPIVWNIEGSPANPDFLEKVAPLDPMVWLPKLGSRTFRLQDSSFVRSTPQASRDHLRSVLPASAATVSYKTQEDFQAVAEEGKFLEWIKSQLRKTSATGLVKEANLASGRQ